MSAACRPSCLAPRGGGAAFALRVRLARRFGMEA